MTRDKIVNTLAALFTRPRYLEIGVSKGATFDSVEAGRKVAVDPNFEFVLPRNPPSGIAYYQCTSDEFFGQAAQDERFDVIFLDGLHTFEQTLRDLLNAIAVLAPGGVIVIDDVLPDSYHASIADHATSIQTRQASGCTSKSWMGDVYRLIFFIQTFLQPYDYATVAGEGQAVVWRSPRPASELILRNVESVARIPFESTLLDREAFREKPLREIVDLVRISVSTLS